MYSDRNRNYEEKAHFHLPGLFEFYSFYQVFLPLFFEHREYFYPWCDIGSIYGAPADCLWGGGRVGFGNDAAEEVASLMEKYHISARLTFSNSLLTEEHLKDVRCNQLCERFHLPKGDHEGNGIIVHSELLTKDLRERYPNFYLVSSTTKVLTDPKELGKEIKRPEFAYVVPDFRLNKRWDFLDSLTSEEKGKVEFLCNECCSFTCKERRLCYENVSRKNLGENCPDHICRSEDSQEGYRFSKAMQNPGFISVEEIHDRYLPRGFTQFKIEGRSLGSAILLEFLLYYMTKPEYHLQVREYIYLDSTLDLF